MALTLYENVDGYEAEYQQVRAAFIAKGSSLNAWLIGNDVNRQLAYRALRGQSLGRKALDVRRQIHAAAFGQVVSK